MTKNYLCFLCLTVYVWSYLCMHSGAIQVSGGLSVMTETFHATVAFNLTSQSFIDFTTDVDFYEDIVMCLRMSRPNFSVRSETHFHLLIIYFV